jgi:hypothetical protein
MGDYPTELTAGSIYSRHERWSGNWTKTRGGQRRRKLLAQLIRGLYCGGLTGDDRMANVNHGGEVIVPRHVAPDHEESISGEPIQGGRDMLGYGGRSKIAAGVHPRRYFLPPALSN